VLSAVTETRPDVASLDEGKWQGTGAVAVKLAPPFFEPAVIANVLLLTAGELMISLPRALGVGRAGLLQDRFQAMFDFLQGDAARADVALSWSPRRQRRVGRARQWWEERLRQGLQEAELKAESIPTEPRAQATWLGAAPVRVMAR